MNRVLEKKLSERKARILYVIILIRVSTERQGDVAHGSKEQQEHIIMSKVKELEKEYRCKIVILKKIMEEVSGWKDKALSKREEMFEALSMAEKGQVDIIMCEKLDRLSRNQEFNIKFRNIMESSKCQYYQADKGFINFNNPSQSLLYGIENSFNDHYSRDLSEKIYTKGISAKIKNGKDSSTMPILGLDPHPLLSCQYVINSAEQKIVEDIYRYFCKTHSLAETVKYAEEKGYRTKKRIAKERFKNGIKISAHEVGGNFFNNATMTTLLKSSKIRGVGKFLDEDNHYPDRQDDEGYITWEYPHGPVLPKELTDRVDELFSINKANQNRNGKLIYMLSGITFATDGTKFTGSKGGNRPYGNYRYYHNAQNNISINKDEFEEVVLKTIKSYIKNNEATHHLVEMILNPSVNV